MKALLIEDDASAAKALGLILTTESFDYDWTNWGKEGFDLGCLHDYDVILLDVDLPDMRGYDVLKKLRLVNVRTPVVMLTGNADIDTKVTCLGLGADDYVIKPFQREELVARVHAVIRRSRAQIHRVITLGRLTVNIDTKTADADGTLIPLTGKEYAILEALALRKGVTLTKEMFLNQLYSSRDEPNSKIIDVFICKLRKKLADACGAFGYIETVWGRGYRMPESV